MSKLRVGSLFAGIGGFDLGLERTGGFKSEWFCEQDEYCKAVLKKHWPTVPCYPDVRELRGAGIAPVDVLCGGFPCQDISVAGPGLGLAGARSGLWSEFSRLIAELRPEYVIVENVPVLRRRGLEKVLADLLACGYDAEWDGISASAVGAPHRRDRIWVIAYPNSGRHWTPQGEIQAGWHGPKHQGWWRTEPNVGRVADGVPSRVDRLKCLGNALVPQIATWIGQRILEYEETERQA